MENQHTAILKWLRATYEQADGFVIIRRKVYEDYLHSCADEKPLAQSILGKLLRKVFPSVQVRRLGTRRVALYHYVGLRQIGDVTAPCIGPPSTGWASRPHLYGLRLNKASKFTDMDSVEDTACPMIVSHAQSTISCLCNINQDIPTQCDAPALFDAHAHEGSTVPPTSDPRPAKRRRISENTLQSFIQAPLFSRKCFHKPTLILPPFLLSNPFLAVDPEACDMARRYYSMSQTITDLILSVRMTEVLPLSTQFWGALPASAVRQLGRPEFASELITYLHKVMSIRIQRVTPDSLIFGDEDDGLEPCCEAALVALWQQAMLGDEIVLHDTLVSVSFRMATEYVSEVLHRFLRQLLVRIPLVLMARNVRKMFADMQRVVGVRRAWVDLVIKTGQVARESGGAAMVQFGELLYSLPGPGMRRLLAIFTRDSAETERLQALCGYLIENVQSAGGTEDKELEAGQQDLRGLLEFVSQYLRWCSASKLEAVAL